MARWGFLSEEFVVNLEYEDIKFLLEVVEEWENIQVTQYHMLSEMISNLPNLNEDHPAYDVIESTKRQFKANATQSKNKLEFVKEQSCGVRAKLYAMKNKYVKDCCENLSLSEEVNSKSEQQPKVCDINVLKKQLKKAIEAENYEEAAKLRDEITKRNE